MKGTNKFNGRSRRSSTSVLLPEDIEGLWLSFCAWDDCVLGGGGDYDLRGRRTAGALAHNDAAPPPSSLFDVPDLFRRPSEETRL